MFNDGSAKFQCELDIYWTVFADTDPIAELGRLKDRVPLIHVKDMAPDEKEDIEVGFGRIEWKPVFKAAEQAGTRWLIVELDHCPNPPLRSIRMCLENLWMAGLN